MVWAKQRIILSLFLFPSFVYNSEILVVADKISSVTLEQTSSVKTFHEEEIISSQHQTIVDLLRRVPGVQIHTAGATGKTASLFLRGTGHRHTLVLIDDIPISDPTSIHGSTRLEFLSLHNVQKIEILKGSQGVRYGSKAVGGVIKITTKKGRNQKRSLLKIGHGQFHYNNFGLSHTGEQKKWNYMISGDWQKTRGISDYPQYKNPKADDDPYSNTTIIGNIEYEPRPQESISIGLRSLKSTFEYDDYRRDNDYNHSIYSSNSYYIKYKYPYAKKMHLEIIQSFMNVKRDIYQNTDGQTAFYYRGREQNLEVSNKFSYKDSNHLLIGFKHKKEQADKLGHHSKNVELSSQAIYANHFFQIGQLFAEQGIRYSQFDLSGDKITSKVGLGLNFNKTTLKTNYATGLKAPSLFTLYNSSFGGNEKLRPESSNSFEIGLLQEFLQHNLELTFFRIEYMNYIDFRYNRYINAGKFRIQGLEFSLEGPLGQSLVAQIHGTFLQGKDLQTGHPPPYRPRLRGGAILTYIPQGPYELELNFEAVGKRKGYDQSNIPPYSVIHIAGNYRIKKNHRLQIKIGNLLNKRYEEVPHYATLGRNIQAQYLVTL